MHLGKARKILEVLTTPPYRLRSNMRIPLSSCNIAHGDMMLFNPHQDLRPQTFRFTGISWRLEFQHLAKLQGPSLSPYFFFLRQLRNTSFVIFAILVCRRKMALYLSQSHVDCLLKRSCSALWCNSLWPSYLRTLLPNWPVARTVWWLILNNFWE